MSPPGAARPPQKRSDRTRRAILDAALTVIARRGIGRATFRDVAAEAEVSPGVVTYHFPNRSDLLSAAYAHHLEETDRQGQAVSEAQGLRLRAGALEGEAAVDVVVALLRSLALADRDSFIASHELTLELTRDPELGRRVQSSLVTHQGLVEKMMTHVGSSEPKLDAEIFSATFEGLALKWLARADDDTFEPHLRRVVARLLERFGEAS